MDGLLAMPLSIFPPPGHMRHLQDYPMGSCSEKRWTQQLAGCPYGDGGGGFGARAEVKE